MSDRISEKALFNMLKNIFKKGDGGVHNDHHESLSDEDKIVENFLEVGQFIAKRLAITNIIRFDCDLINENDCPLKAVLSDGSLVDLDFDKHITSNDCDMAERLMESEALIFDCDRLYIQKRIVEKSQQIYSKK